MNINNYIDQKLKDKFNYICFENESHSYSNQEGEEYRSVSSIINQFSTPFDVEYYSQKSSEYKNIPQDEIKSLWAIRRDFSIVKGTEFHLYAQVFLSEQRKFDYLTSIQNEIKLFHEFWEKNNQSYQVIATELIVADDELKIAGTVDCIVRHIKSKNYFIFDWKTNREIEKKYKSKKMLKPISHLEGNNLNKYYLQMSFYKYLLNKNTDINIKNSFIVHFSSLPNYKIYQTKDLSQEINDIILSVVK
jgi:hypothetical protein